MVVYTMSDLNCRRLRIRQVGVSEWVGDVGVYLSVLMHLQVSNVPDPPPEVESVRTNAAR